MGRDGTALLPLLCAIVLLRIYPAEAESEIKMISTFSLIITNHLQKHWEKEHVCWVLGFAATGSACTCLEHNTAAAMLQAGWETRTALTCSPGVPTGAMCNSQAKNAICPFPESQVVTERGKTLCQAGRWTPMALQCSFCRRVKPRQCLVVIQSTAPQPSLSAPQCHTALLCKALPHLEGILSMRN